MEKELEKNIVGEGGGGTEDTGKGTEGELGERQKRQLRYERERERL